MLLVDESELERLEWIYPGIRGSIQHFESASQPPCPYCESLNTTRVVGGVVGRTLYIAQVTTKMKLSPNATNGPWYCLSCEGWIDTGKY